MRFLPLIARPPAIRAFLLLAVFFCFCSCCCTLAARADALPHPWAPWMGEDSSFGGSDRASSFSPDAPSPTHYRNKSRPPFPTLAAKDDRDLSALSGDKALLNPSDLSDSEWESLRRDLLETSALERMYSGRIIDPLGQFGYDLFKRQAPQNLSGATGGGGGSGGGNGGNSSVPLPAGAAQDNVLLNFGDKLQLTFRGQRNDQKTYTIDNEGLLIVPDLSPIPAAGRSLGDLRKRLEAEAQNLHNTDVFVSLVAVQKINILVIGHVTRPGHQALTVFNTVLDALTSAGGIEKTGTLRQIKLVRQGRSTMIDLYGLLVYGGGGADLMLQDGDRLIVPPIGPTVAISGEVKRPGIYEILPLPPGIRRAQADDESEKLSLDEMLDFAGGPLAPGLNRFLKLEITRKGEESTEDITDHARPLFGDGSILVVSHGEDKRSGSIELLGHTRRPGLYALDETPTLSKLLRANGAPGPDIYPLIGVIARYDPDRMTTSFIDFPLRLVLNGKTDRALRDADKVYLFSTGQIRRLEAGEAEAEPPDRLNARSDEGAENAFSEQGSADPPLDDAGEEAISDPALRSFLREHAARLRGAVRAPGAWPVAEGATLDTLLAVAGGMTLDADAASIELTSALSGDGGKRSGEKTGIGARRIMVSFDKDDPQTVRVSPGDTIRINHKLRRNEEKTVRIIGEVAHPGTYDLLPGEHLSSLLDRAGGVTPDAYPEGAIFSRESERRAEESRFKAAARDLERSIAVATDDGKDNNNKKPDMAELSVVRDLAAQLREAQAVGRITVEADPNILATKPELDILLESGDRIYIPKRPLTVRVTGEVLSPAALQFRSGKDARDYIDEAGGFTFNADKDRVFVVYPDGSAQPLSVDLWNHKPNMIPPGSAIVVPRDPKPFDFIESAEKISRIVSNLALTGIWLDDLRSD